MKRILTRALIVPLAATALAGCNEGGVALTNASPEEVAKAAEKAGPAGATLRAGQWETTVELVDANMPGMPPEMKKQMLEGPNRTRTHSYCITPEQAAKPGSELLLGEANKNCTYNNFSMSGGKLEATLTCKSPQDGSTLTMATSATYTPDTMQGTATMTMPEMSMKTRMSSRRTGECTEPAPAKAG